MANHIGLYFHCKQCVAEKPPNLSPAEWQRLRAGWTSKGLQVWCERHNINIIHIDFEGVKHKADTTTSGDFN